MESNSTTNDLIPFSTLILYSKHWLHFPWIDVADPERIWKELSCVLKIQGYFITNKDDIIRLVTIAADDICQFLKDRNKKIPYGLRNFFEFNKGIDEHMRYYECDDYEEALIRHVCSSLSMLEGCKEFSFYNIDYRKFKLKQGFSVTSETYKTCQWKFNKMFKNNIVPNPNEKYLKDSLKIFGF